VKVGPSVVPDARRPVRSRASFGKRRAGEDMTGFILRIRLLKVPKFFARSSHLPGVGGSKPEVGVGISGLNGDPWKPARGYSDNVRRMKSAHSETPTLGKMMIS
jgi:hypothetical protein